MGISAVAVLDICVPSGVFLYNNIKKVENGEKARGTVVFAQSAKIAQAVAKYHDDTAKTATEAYNIFGKYAEKSKALDWAGKGINWATRNVNPLICMSAAYKTVTADDKLQTGISQLGAISGMFLGEGLMKLNMDKVINEENVNQLAQKGKNIPGLKSVSEFILKNSNGGKMASILRGVAFVCTSMASYDLGQRLADGVASRMLTDAGLRSRRISSQGIPDRQPQITPTPPSSVEIQTDTPEIVADNSSVIRVGSEIPTADDAVVAEQEAQNIQEDSEVPVEQYIQNGSKINQMV